MIAIMLCLLWQVDACIYLQHSKNIIIIPQKNSKLIVLVDAFVYFLSATGKKKRKKREIMCIKRPFMSRPSPSFVKYSIANYIRKTLDHKINTLHNNN